MSVTNRPLGHGGMSISRINFDEQLLERCEAIGHVASLQTPLSLIARESAGGLIQWCAAHGVGVIVYSPMQVGLLTDSFTADQVDRLNPCDWPRRHPEFLSPRLERNLALRDALRPIAMAHYGRRDRSGVDPLVMSTRRILAAVCTAEPTEAWVSSTSSAAQLEARRRGHQAWLPDPRSGQEWVGSCWL